MLSSRAPNAAASSSSGSALADAVSSWNIGHLGNTIVSNSILVGAAQQLGIDEYFASQPGDGPVMSALKEGTWTAVVGQAGGMLRSAVPMLRLW